MFISAYILGSEKSESELEIEGFSVLIKQVGSFGMSLW